MELGARWAWSLHPGPWIGWAALFAALTIGPFRWHLEYFRNPGPGFHRAMQIVIPLLAAACLAYCRLRSERVRRWELPALALSVLAPCVIFEPRALLVGVALAAGATALGAAALAKLGVRADDSVEGGLLALGAGLGLLMFVLLPLGVARLYSWPLFAALFTVPILVWRNRLAALGRRLRDVNRAWAGDASLGSALTGAAVFFTAVFLAVATLLILAPTVAHDSIMMHLAAARAYASAGGLDPLPFQPYSYYPQGAETLMTAVYALAGQPAVQFVHPMFLVLTLGAVAALGRRLGMSRAACFFAAAALLATPFVLWDGAVIKNDLAVAAFQLLAVCCAFGSEDESGKPRLRLGVFLLASSLAVKHTAVFGLPWVGLLLLLQLRGRRGALRETAVWALLFGVTVCGWPARAYAYTGNPFFPQSFRRAVGRVAPALGEGEAWLGVPYLEIPWYVHFAGLRAFESPTANPLGFFLILSLPAWVLLERRKLDLRLVALAGVAGCYYVLWGALFPFLRYAIVLAGLLYVMAGERFEALYRLAGSPLRAAIWGTAVYNFVLCLMPAMIISLNGPQLELFAGRISRSEYLRRALAPYSAMEYLQANAGACDLVLGAWVTTAGYAPVPAAFHPVYPAENWAAVIQEELAQRPYRYLVATDTVEGRAAGEQPPAGYRSALRYEDGRFLVFQLEPPEASGAPPDCFQGREYDTLR